MSGAPRGGRPYNTAMEVHLVDGTYELFRAHYGAPAAAAPRSSRRREMAMSRADRADRASAGAVSGMPRVCCWKTVTPFLAERALANDKNGQFIAWLTPGKAMSRFATAAFRKRDLFSDALSPEAVSRPKSIRPGAT